MWVWMILMLAVVVMAAYYMRCKKPVQSILFGVCSGLVSLAIIGMIGGNLIHFNLFTIVFSAAAGLPGVLAVLFIENFIV